MKNFDIYNAIWGIICYVIGCVVTLFACGDWRKKKNFVLPKKYDADHLAEIYKRMDGHFNNIDESAKSLETMASSDNHCLIEFHASAKEN